MADLRTVNDVFYRLAGSRRRDAMLAMQADGSWLPISSGQVYQRVRYFAQALLEWGIAKGDRVALLSENRWEWAVTDFASLAIGAVDVPIYPTLTAEQVGDLLADSGARVAVVSSRAQYEKVAAIRHRTRIERVVVMDEDAAPNDEDAIPFSSLLAGADWHAGNRDEGFDRRAAAVEPSDLATLIYTSGTTGEPKGVMLTHGNLASNLSHSTTGLVFNAEDSCISFLPLSHVTARHLDYALFLQGVSIAYCPAFERLPAAMLTARPTIFVAVPRVYEKIRQEVERRASQSGIKRRLLAWAIHTGRRFSAAILAGRKPASPGWTLADKLVFAKVRGAFGGRVRLFVSGGAPLGLDTGSWFAAVGVPILEGYGLTETSPVIAINIPSANRLGSVGRILSNIECRIADDGELLVRGPSIFHGYWQKPEATAEAIDVRGWFHTGDIGHIDTDGFLYITDRKKDLLKTSGGKLIAPQPIENKLKANLLVGQAALVGDRHKFLCVLISPNFPALEEWAASQGIAAPSRRALVEEPRVVARYRAIVDEVNGTLANFETMKRVRLVPDEWQLDTGELTPSMKLKRRVIAEKYAQEIAEFYADEAVAHA